MDLFNKYGHYNYDHNPQKIKIIIHLFDMVENINHYVNDTSKIEVGN